MKTLMKLASGCVLLMLSGCGHLNDQYSCPAANGLGCTPLHRVHEKTSVSKIKNMHKKFDVRPNSQKIQHKIPSTPHYTIFFPAHLDAQGNYWTEQWVTHERLTRRVA